ncbi:hypothetical protein [Pseudomonas kilonensis]|uniref:hypothetical protein n=1 Tax=Pseudomonas kilonensis TaxID=132476 RepID=UPI00209F025E|nr:hypothetical protein [Pseudomonas kilonensis]MCP1452647.1 hypothetical protein [Pseudomonas kilonensis]
MKAKCTIDNLNSSRLSLETLARLKQYISRPDGELDLAIGKEYVVYGIEFWDNCPWLYICRDNYDEYPVPVAADFFEITDKRLSTHWQLNSKEASNNKNQTQLVFSEWASDELFYENLISGDKHAEATFDKYRKVMDAE